MGWSLLKTPNKKLRLLGVLSHCRVFSPPRINKPASLNLRGAGSGGDRKHSSCRVVPFPRGKPESPLDGGHAAGLWGEGCDTPPPPPLPAWIKQGYAFTLSRRSRAGRDREARRPDTSSVPPLPRPARQGARRASAGPRSPQRQGAPPHPGGPQRREANPTRPAHPEALPQLTPAGA